MLTQQNNKAVIYCRVSTKEQVEEGNSLVTQERMCREYAHKNKYDIAAIFVEQGESAKTVDRTELKKLIAFCAIKKNDVSAVIAYKIDRISRNMDDYSQIRILFKKYGVEIKSTSENFEDTPAGRFMENILANVAQFDNDVRTERCTGGMKDAVREGRYVWQAPLGYSNVRVDGRATIAPNHFAPIIRKTFEALSISYSHVEVIRKQMGLEGLSLLSGKPLSKAYFYRLIRNELYAGWISKFGERHRGLFQPVISEELYSKVQMLLNHKKRPRQKRLTDNPDFPLRRFMRHPSGKLLTGAWSTGCRQKYAYYLIHKAGINIRKHDLENAFKEWLNCFRMDIVHFGKLYAYVNANLQRDLLEDKGAKIRLEGRLVALKNKQNSIINKNLDGVISDELCKEKLADINAELYDVQKTLTTSSEEGLNKEEVLKLVREVLTHPGDLWDKADLQGKVKLQWFYFPHGIEIDKNGSRTTKICRLFNLKELISPYQSPKVDHRFQKSNKNFTQISLPSPENLDIESPDYWDEIKEEVTTLKEILSREGNLSP